MKRAWVKYFSPNDWSIGKSLSIAEQIIQSFDNDKIYSDVNEIIELYNIKQFFDNSIYLEKWTTQEKAGFRAIVDCFPKHIGRFFNAITDDNLIAIFITLNRKHPFNYSEEFWCLLEFTNAYKSISHEVFKLVTEMEGFALKEVLYCPKITKYFSAVFSTSILADICHVPLILGELFVKPKLNEKRIYLPDISSVDLEQLILQYIRSDNPNANYLNLIAQAPGDPRLALSDMTKLEAKRKAEAVTARLFENSDGLRVGVEISFSEEQELAKEHKYEHGIAKISYNLSWIKENIDYPTLLNNFIYLFEFTDTRFRSLHVQNPRHMGVFEQLMGVTGKTEYVTGITFEQVRIMALLQNVAYRNVLKNNGVHLEDIIQWFFSDYLNDEFGAAGFQINMPFENSGYLEKCRTILSEIESVLKQFKMYVELDGIDWELMRISSTHLFFKDIPSFISKKYVYGNDYIYNRASFDLFSDQSLLSSIIDTTETYDSLLELLLHEKVAYSDCSWQQAEIEWLIEQNFIYVDANGDLALHKIDIALLKDLYYNQVGCMEYYSQKLKTAICNFEEKNILIYGGTLFSKPEQDYLNYLLNRSDFSNGLDLRNKYIHGTQGENHEENYSVFLNILILIIIKINEEFCLRQKRIDEQGDKFSTESKC